MPYRGEIFRILNTGPENKFEIAERSPGVRILITSNTHILLTREWRHECDAFDLRLPGGKVCNSLNAFELVEKNDLEDACRSAAQRELYEETTINLVKQDFSLIHRSICGATVKWDLWYYFVDLPDATMSRIEVSNLEGEEISVQWFSFREAAKLCLNGEIKEDRTAAVILRFLHRSGTILVN